MPPEAFRGSQLVRTYKNEISNIVLPNFFSESLISFCHQIDKFYIKFFNNLAKNIHDEVVIKTIEVKNDHYYKKILNKKYGMDNWYFINPKDADIINILSHNGNYESIRYNWMNELNSLANKTLIVKNGEENNNNLNIYTSIGNIALRETVSGFILDTPYLSEAIGFFSWMFMKNYFDQKAPYYGSCITYSLLELYVGSRLHENVKLGLQFEDVNKNEIKNHPYWKKTEATLDDFLSRKHNLFASQQKYGISHWITNIGGKYDRAIEQFRIVDVSMHENKREFFAALICPVFDSYETYWKKNTESRYSHLTETTLIYLLGEMNTIFDKIFEIYDKQ
jgi:hypothetical protein